MPSHFTPFQSYVIFKSRSKSVWHYISHLYLKSCFNIEVYSSLVNYIPLKFENLIFISHVIDFQCFHFFSFHYHSNKLDIYHHWGLPINISPYIFVGFLMYRIYREFSFYFYSHIKHFILFYLLYSWYLRQ